jgi:hypothetical protein
MLQTDKTKVIPKEVVLPVSLYQSIQGRYFVGYAENVTASPETNAWAALSNPVGSGVLLFANVITVTNVTGPPFEAEFWFNAQFPGTPMRSDLVTPSNTAIKPLPVPKVEIFQASNVPNTPPTRGVKVYAQQVFEESTIVFEENGKYIFPPGGSLTVYLNLIGSLTTGRVAFGWWEKPLTKPCDGGWRKGQISDQEGEPNA